MRNSLKRDIGELMRLDARYRDNDYDLLLKVWEDHGLVLNTAQRMAFRETPPADVIIRRRREWSTVYPPSLLVSEKRYKKYKVMIDEFSPGNWFQRFISGRGL